MLPSFSRARRRRPALVASLATLAVTAALTTTPGGAASSAPLDCPQAYPEGDLAPDQDVTGYTVSQGRTPEEFTGKVVGVLEDGIAPDVDMIMVRLTSDEINRVGGIWAGMSGSPVYIDGQLVGAVAYGLSWGPSPVAGVTPAADMQRLIDGGTQVRRAARDVAIPRRTADRLVADGTLTRAEADGGMTELATPLAVSGMGTKKRLKKATKRLGLSNVQVYRAGSAPTERVAPADAGIVPGGNLAASLSYGDFSAVGTGTVTMVCSGDVVGFGHPFNWTGRTSMTLHNADALYIQEDSLGAPFKVSNPLGPVGTIDQDRQTGIAGFVGDTPDVTDVESSLTSTEGGSRTGHTYVSMPDYLPDLAALGVVANAGRVLDAATDGTATTGFTISGTTRSGDPFTLTRDNVMADSYDIAYMAPYELYDVLYRLQTNKYTAVDIDDITFDGTLSPDYRRYTLDTVEVKQDGAWRTVTRRSKVVAKPGQVLKMRVNLGSFRDELAPKSVRINVPVTWRRGEGGEVLVSGGDQGELFFKSAARSATQAGAVQARRAGSFQSLIDSIEDAPRNDQVTVSLQSFDEGGGAAADAVSAPQDDVVGGFKFFRLVVKG